MSSILVLAGGDSDERDVSLRSGQAVAAALKSNGHDVSVIDPAQVSSETVRGFDIVFPVLHGRGGEDGSIQQTLENLHVAYVGSDVSASELCFDKWLYKQRLAQRDLPLAPSEMVSASSIKNSRLVHQPFVLKPSRGGSSVDTFIIRDPHDVDWNKLQSTLDRYGEMLLEALVVGTEITVAVLGEAALPVIEIIPPESGEFDYENKYNGKSQELCPPEHVSKELQSKAQDLALQAHQLCGCRDFSRTDIMISAAGQLFILETNTIPGMTDQSLFPKAAGVSGLSMPELVNRLVSFALARKV